MIATTYQYKVLTESDAAKIIGGRSCDIAFNLKTLRISSGLNQTHVANNINICQSTYARYEKGTRIPDIDTLIDLSLLFNVNLNEIVSPNNSDII